MKQGCKIETIFICCPGPSLTQEQVNLVREKGHFMIMVGNAWRMNPYADVLYHCDDTWWKYHNGVPEFKGDEKFSLEQTIFPDVQRLEISPNEKGFDLTFPYIVHGANSGYQALNLALHYGAKNVFLLGYDMKPGPNGEHNIDGDHPPEIKRDWLVNLYLDNFNNCTQYLENLGIGVYNCNLDSALNCFPKVELLDVI